MRRLVEFPLEDGSTILVETDEPEQGGLGKPTRGGDVVARAQQSLEKSLERVQPAAQYVIQQLRKLSDAPDEIHVAFGLKLSAEAGAVLASASAEANYTVTLKWVKEKEVVKPKA
jgi:NTP-dependent ternary system trypsin peptidase co-occuring protein